jgi:hypothetical protein
MKFFTNLWQKKHKISLKYRNDLNKRLYEKWYERIAELVINIINDFNVCLWFEWSQYWLLS